MSRSRSRSRSDLPAAEAKFREALANPLNVRARHDLGELLLGQGRLAEAAEQVAAALEIKPDQPPLLQLQDRIRARLQGLPPIG